MALFLAAASVDAAEKVVLIHGLARTPRSMARMERRLKQEGFDVANIGYPSRKHSIEELAAMVRKRIVAESEGFERAHLVTHSMGGILVRHIQRHDPLGNLGRVVMLSPPNHGSRCVDALAKWRLFKTINGPAGLQLGAAEGGPIHALGPAHFEVGILTGDRSVNWILSCMIPGPDDGKVAVQSAKLEGMTAFKVIHATHPFIMRRKDVIRDVAAFLRTGAFGDD